MYQGWFEEPLAAPPEPPSAGAAVPALVLVVVGLEPVAVFEVPFEHNPRNQDWISLKPFGSLGQAPGQTVVAVV